MISVRRSSLLLLVVFLANLFPAAPAMSPFVGTMRAAASATPPPPESRTSGPLPQRQLPSLTLHIDVAPGPVVVGATATISVTVTNQAPHAARGLTVTLPVPDGATPIPGDGLVSTSEGWRWSRSQLDGGASTAFTATLKLERMPAGQALLAHAQASANGLELPVQEIAGALALDAQPGETSHRFVPGQSTMMRSTDGRVEVQFPGKASDRPLTLRYSRQPAAGENHPPAVAWTNPGFGTFFLNANDDQGKDVHQFAAPLTIKARYTEAQLQVLGIAEDDLTFFWFDPQAGANQQGAWVQIPTTLDPQNNSATAMVDHFSAYQLSDGSSPSEAYIPSLKGWQVSMFTGHASFSMPIEVPAGPDGIKPDLKLSYSSGSSDGGAGLRPKQQAGWVGKGWSLDTGMVSRNKTTINPGTNKWIETYTVVFNGQSETLARAEALAGNTGPDDPDPTHWAWRPTDESFIKVRAVPNGNSWGDASGAPSRGGYDQTGWKPRYKWQVWAKDGTLFEFEEDLWYGWNRCASANTTDVEGYKWLLSRVVDVHKNTINYRYGRDTWVWTQASCDPWNYGRVAVDRDAWPTEITWGGNPSTGAADRYKVEFVSSARTNDTAYDGAANQYGGNYGQPRETRRLDAIKVWSLPGPAWELVREYRFNLDDNGNPLPDSQVYKLFSDQTIGANQPNTAYPKLTLNSITEYAKDGTTRLPRTWFEYGTDRGTATWAKADWNRLRLVNNGQGGQESFTYEQVGEVENKSIFNNHRRVKARTLTDGRGNSYTYTYSYVNPALNSLGTELASKMVDGDGDKGLYSQSLHQWPNSAVLYYNKYWDPDHPYKNWLSSQPMKDFRGHSYVDEIDPSNTLTRHHFVQGDVGCYPKDSFGAPLEGNGIVNDPCFQQLRDREFLKGKERLTQVFGPATSAGRPLLKETTHNFTVSFFDYGAAPLSGLFRAWNYEHEKIETTWDGASSLSKRTAYTYDESDTNYVNGVATSTKYGNLASTEEFDEQGNLLRRTKHYYAIRDAEPYIADRKSATIVTDAAWNQLEYTANFYDGNATPRSIGTTGDLTRVSKLYADPPQAGLSGNLLSVDTSYSYDSYGNRLTETEYAAPGTSWVENSVRKFSAPGNGSAASTTTTTYDATFHALSVQVDPPAVNGIVLTERATYDLRMGSLTSVTDPNGNVTSAEYDGFGRMVKLIKSGDSSSAPTVQAVYYDWEQPFRYIVSAKDEVNGVVGNRPIIKFYDGLGREIQTKKEAAEGAQTVITDKVYDGLDRMIKDSQPRYRSETPNDTFFAYVQPDTSVRYKTTSYDALGRESVVTLPDGSKTWHFYGVVEDQQGKREFHSVINANRHNTQYRYDSLGRLHQVLEIAGDCGWYGFACTGSYTTPYAEYARTIYGYDRLDRLTSVVDANSNLTTMAYDALGRKVSMSEPNMGAWSYAYDTDSKLVRQTDAKNQTITYSYDALGRLIARGTTGLISDAYETKDSTAWSYNQQQTVPFSDDSKTGSNRVVKTAGTGTGWTGTFYRSAYNLTSGEGAQVRFKVDSAASDAHIAVESDAGGVNNRFGVRHMNGNLEVQYTVDGTSWVYPKTLIPNLVPGVWYVLQLTLDDASGFSVLAYQENNPTVRNSYTYAMPAGKNWRFRHWVYSDASYLDDYREFTSGVYRYDEPVAHGKGQRTSIGNAAATTHYRYDARGQKLSEEHIVNGLSGNRVFAWTYDAGGRVKSLQYPNGEVVHNGYDAAGRQTSTCYDTSQTRCLVRGATYDELDQPLQWTFGLDSTRWTQSWSYETLSRRLAQTSVSTASIFSRSYTYDLVGNVAKISDAITSQWQDFRYDHRDRLISAKTTNGSTGVYNEQYTYDKIGNLTSKGDVSAPVSYSYGANGNGTGAGPHQVRSKGGQAYGYDANGNLIAGGGRSFSWTTDNLVASVTGADGVVERYTYDADGERLTKRRSGVTTVYLSAIWEEEIERSVSRQQYLFQAKNVAQRTNTATGSTLNYLHNDHLGGPGVLLNENGTWKSGQDFTPWGAVRSGGMPETSLSFTGQRQDETGLLYYHARYYDPELGRFISADTVVPEVGALTVAPSDKTAAPLFDKGGKGAGSDNPQELNRYAYATNNPLRYTDPTGHYIESALDIAGIAFDAYDIYNNGLNWTNGLSMAGNIAGLLLPGVTGVGAGVRAVAKGAQVANKARQATRASAMAGKAGRVAAKIISAACSFSAETVVSTTEGPKAISAIKNGDQVLAYHEALGTTGSYTVTAVISHVDPVIVHLTIAGELLETTPEHPFSTEEQGWTSAGDLWVGAHVRKLDDTVGTVESVAFVAQTQPMYNLSVAEAHTFFVGDEQWLVHNNCLNTSRHVQLLKKYGQGGYKLLENGRVRYYGIVKAADKQGPMLGRRMVKEWDPETGATRLWHETVDHFGRVRIVRPETGGPKTHYMFDELGNYVEKW